jgi:CBS domain-containing protein
MKVSDVMTTDPITVRAQTPYKELVDLLVEHRIGGLPVVDDHGALLGIVTETDLITKEAYGDERHGPMAVVGAMLAGRDHHWLQKAAGLEAGKIMTSKLVTTEPDEDVHVAARRLLEHRVGRLPVVESRRLVGIVSRSDLLRPFQRGDEQIATDVEARLNDPVTFERSHGVSFAVANGVVTLTGTVPFPHDIGPLGTMISDVPGVVKVDNKVTAVHPEPPPPPRQERNVPWGA